MNITSIKLEEKSGFDRVNEPVTLGIPFLPGRLFDNTALTLTNERGELLPLQTEILDRWSDKSCRWILADFQATVNANQKTLYSLAFCSTSGPIAVIPNEIRIFRDSNPIRVDTGAASFVLDERIFRPFSAVIVRGNDVLESGSSCVLLTDADGREWEPRTEKISGDTVGPLRSTLFFEGSFRHPGEEPALAAFFARIHFFAGHSVVKIEFTIRNSRRARHTNGLWDLGDVGSVYFKDLSIYSVVQAETAEWIYWAHNPGLELNIANGHQVEIYQDSSGGENWDSRNHVNRFGEIMNMFRGYRIQFEGITHRGERAEPTLFLSSSTTSVGAAIPTFWQNFPKAIEAKNSSLIVRLFPTQYAEVFELQGGEQKTHAVYFHYGRVSKASNPLFWVHRPILPQLSPATYVDSTVFPYMVSEASDLNPEYINLVHGAIEGRNSFFERREIIDEYGWRNFGDLYADHEAVYYAGPKPIISHYNNQYDAIYSFALHYARSGDPRWFELMQDLASHVIDIDIYHTPFDKPAYSGGLFWHTDHYTDAVTCTHRTFSKQTSIGKNLKDYGGGPCNEHLYTTGLMTFYFLTGDFKAREAVLGLADWVIRMDNGNLTPLRFLSRDATGLASQTGGLDYHGPGRGAANSINALLDAHRLSRADVYLLKAEELIRRCIHPTDLIEHLGLRDAERRWSYLVFLQTLGKYLDSKVEWDQLDDMFYYARESLLQYARWMLENEVPYGRILDRVEYPTETWIVHDLRKSNIFEWAALYCPDDERESFLKQAKFFYDNCFRDLNEFDTKSCTRSLVLLLQYGWMHGYFQQPHDFTRFKGHQRELVFNGSSDFKPQRQIAEERFKLLCGISGCIVIGVMILLTLSAK